MWNILCNGRREFKPEVRSKKTWKVSRPSVDSTFLQRQTWDGGKGGNDVMDAQPPLHLGEPSQLRVLGEDRDGHYAGPRQEQPTGQ